MASLAGFGAYVPDRRLSNAELAARLDCTPEWIYEVSGIESRHIAEESQTVEDLALLAAQNCLGELKIESSEIGMILVSSGSAARRFPGPAASVGKALGIPGVPCLDIPVASAGSLFGLALAGRLSEAYGTILLVAAEKMSEISQREPLDKNVAILFGDGAGACLVTPGSKGLCIVDSVLHSDGAFANDLFLDADGRLGMNGLTVIMQASRKIPAAIQEVLKKRKKAAADIAVFLMHQANQNLIDRVAKGLGVPGGRFYSNISHVGNTSSASMLIAAAEYFRLNKLNPGERAVFAAFGAGFHWGALLTESSEVNFRG
ncbi:MAG TPA: ketoacyl-ACP synthase III [Bryobacteraceae bacterium]|nr:ketoacyl-ACP synthase III [Bryobacteraceae bacterium]